MPLANIGRTDVVMLSACRCCRAVDRNELDASHWFVLHSSLGDRVRMVMVMPAGRSADAHRFRAIRSATCQSSGKTTLVYVRASRAPLAQLSMDGFGPASLVVFGRGAADGEGSW